MATVDAEVIFVDDSEATESPSLTATTISGQIRYTTLSGGSFTIPPISGHLHISLVQFDGAIVEHLENAVVTGGVNIGLNTWETWSFDILAVDPKAQHILNPTNRLLECQVWWGDILLAWGPMVRPTVSNGIVNVSCVGAAWHLSRRHIGKANRYNYFKNPSFDDGSIQHWGILREAFWLDYQPLDANQVRLGGPGKEGPNSGRLEINSDLRPPSQQTGSGGGVTHNVVSGNTLWGLADQYYGSGSLWFYIYADNATQIKDDAIAHGQWNPRDPGHWIYPGQTLTIPGAETFPVHTEEPEDEAVRWGDTYAYQEITVMTGDRPQVWTLKAWVYIPGQQFYGWGIYGRGVFLSLLPQEYKYDNFMTQNGLGYLNGWDGRRAYYTDVIEHTSSRLGPGHAFDRWVRHECSITLPANSTHVLHARLDSVSGLTYWDQASLTFDSAFERLNYDQALIISDLVDEAQEEFFDKTDVNLTADTPLTGVNRSVIALHEEHANIWDLILAGTKESNGFDVSMQYTPTERKLTTHFPYKGSIVTGQALQIGRNIANYSWSFDGEASASTIIVLAAGQGSDREEFAITDTSTFAGGVITETVIAIGPEYEVEQLPEVAKELSVTNRSPEVLTVQTFPNDVTRPERSLIGYLNIGDYVPVTIQDGAIYDGSDNLIGWNFSIEGELYRITSMVINADSTMSLTLNKRDPNEETYRL